MNINLKNRTVFTKILLGFVLILVLAALMAGVLFYSLGSVSGVLRQMAERNAPTVRYSTGVERYAMRSILSERSYFLLEKKEIHEQVQRDIPEIYANLARVDEVAAKYSDQDLLQKSRDVRRAVERYQGCYNRGVDLLKEDQILEDKMRMLGTKVTDLSHAQTLEHQRLLKKAITDGMDQKEHIEGLHLYNEVEKAALEARMQEKKYLLYKKQEHFEMLKKHIAYMMKLLKELSRVDLGHQSLIEETRRATDEYMAAAERWVANENELRGILSEIQEIGVKVQETARSVQEAGWREMDERKKIAQHTREKASVTGILVAVITLITGLVCAFFIARGIAGPIKELSRATDRIAEGDLKHRVRIKASDEMGQLGISFNKMSEGLQKTTVSRDYYDNIIKSMMDSLIVLDKEAKIETMNPATHDLLGYTEEELIGQPASILFAEEEEEEEAYRVFQFFREPEKAGLIRPQDTIRNRGLTYKTKDGRLIPMLFNASVLRDKTGNITGVVAGAKDITDLKLAEAEIRKEKTFSENIIATIPDSLLVLDKDLTIKKANRSFYQVFGTEHEKAIGARITDILGDEDGRLSAMLTRLSGTEDNIEYFELHYPSEKLGERIFSITARNIIFAEEEEEEEELLVITDITERKQAEEALRANEERYRLHFENVSDVIFSFDREFRILTISPSLERVLGYKPEEVIGKAFAELNILSPEDHQKAFSAVMRVFGGEHLDSIIYEFIARDGTRKYGEVSSAPLIRDGQVVAAVSVARDITDRKRMEGRLKRQLDRLAALHAIDMAINASLDIRVTLNVFLEQVINTLHVDAADILLLDLQNYNKLSFVAGRGFRTNALRYTNLSLGEGFAGRVAQERKTICIPDLEKEAQDLLKISPQISSEDFVAYYGAPLIAKGQVKGVLEIFNRTPLEPDQEWLDFLEALATQAAIAADNAMLFDDLQKSNLDLIQAYDNTLEGWSNALDLRDRETEGHSQRVTEMTLRMARQMGMRDSELVHVRRGALLHDIGKMGIPDGILLKPGPLNDEEWEIMRKHPVYAYELLYPISYLRPAVDIPYSHHEKWDGTGYPRGLKGVHIPLAARVFAIIDVWDALRSERPYRSAWPEEKVREHIKEQTGKHFDPKVVEVFMELLNEFKTV